MSHLPRKFVQACRVAEGRRRRLHAAERIVLRMAEVVARCEDRVEEAETMLAVPELGKAWWYLQRLREAFGQRVDVTLGTSGGRMFLQVRDPVDGRLQAFDLTDDDMARSLEEVAAEIRTHLEARGLLPREEKPA